MASQYSCSHETKILGKLQDNTPLIIQNIVLSILIQTASNSKFNCNFQLPSSVFYDRPLYFNCIGFISLLCSFHYKKHWRIFDDLVLWFLHPRSCKLPKVIDDWQNWFQAIWIFGCSKCESKLINLFFLTYDSNIFYLSESF